MDEDTADGESLEGEEKGADETVDHEAARLGEPEKEKEDSPVEKPEAIDELTNTIAVENLD